MDYFNCGSYYLRSDKNLGYFYVENFIEVYDKILPFLRKYPVLGVKHKDFLDF